MLNGITGDSRQRRTILNPFSLTAASIARKRGSAATRFSIHARAAVLPIRKASAPPSVLPIDTQAVRTAAANTVRSARRGFMRRIINLQWQFCNGQFAMRPWQTIAFDCKLQNGHCKSQTETLSPVSGSVLKTARQGRDPGDGAD